MTEPKIKIYFEAYVVILLVPIKLQGFLSGAHIVLTIRYHAKDLNSFVDLSMLFTFLQV